MEVSPELILVTPDECNSDLHTQLVSPEKRDKVHPLDLVEQLLTYRLGYQDFSKRCYALIDDARQIIAAIYTHASYMSPAEATWQTLPGRVDQILSEPSRKLNAEPDIITFYSISSFCKGSGVELIRSLHSVFTAAANPPILTTLSPLRSFRSWVEERGYDLSMENMREKALEYLGLKADPVQKFHQGNGAIVGAVHAQANAPGTADDLEGLNFMVSYRYPRNPEHLEENRYQFKNGNPAPAAAHLRPLFGG